MNDGLYRVMYKDICAGFVIECGCITMCAPVLRRKMDFWRTIAVKIN